MGYLAVIGTSAEDQMKGIISEGERESMGSIKQPICSLPPSH